jgi:hypothetical protein
MIHKRTLDAKEKYEGAVFKTNKYGDVEVTEYIDSHNITVKFLNTGAIKNTTASALTTGILKDSEVHDTHKYGVMDIPKSVGRGGRCDPLYKKWNGMMQRCYNPKNKIDNPTYEACTSSETFRHFSKFKSWYYSQIGCEQEGWHLDKDILIKGNKVYSEDTCCVVPPEINVALTNNKSVRGSFPQGVIYNSTKTRYRARIQRGYKWESLGTYDTPEEAFYAYKPIKEAYIKSLAEKWKDKIDVRVYEALINWEVSIDD